MSKNTKKLSLLIAVIMLFSSITTLASEKESSDIKVQEDILISNINIAEEIDNALNGVIDESIPHDVLNQIDVGVQVVPKNSLGKNLTNAENDFDVYYTVKNVGDIYDGDTVGTMYSATVYATQKESTGNSTEGGVNSYITIVWIDNLGLNNVLKGVYGGWTPNGKTLSNRSVVWWVDESSSSESRFPSGNSYSYSMSRNGSTFYANSWVDVANYPYSVSAYVKTSIFD